MMTVFRRKFTILAKGISLLIRKPALLNTLIDLEDQHEHSVKDSFQLQTGFPEIDYFKLWNSDTEEILPFAFLDGGSLPTDLALLRILAKKLNAQTYFEIGTWRGESASNVASIIPHCFTLNLSTEQMRTRNWAEEYIQLHEHYSKAHKNITHLHGDSREYDFTEYHGKMDLVFVDGDHHYLSVVQDTHTAFKLIRPGGIIVWHDYGHSPESIRWNVAHAILEGCPIELRAKLYAISNTLCAAYLPFEVQTQTRHYPRKPEHSFKITLERIQS